MKVLLAAPVYSGKDYTASEWIASIKIISDYYGFDVALCDNTKDNGEYLEKLKKVCPDSWTFFRYKPKEREPSQTSITNSQNILREHFLKNKAYDKFLFIEEDIYPPINFFDRMMIESERLNADIYSGMYFIDNGEMTHPMLQSLFITRDKNGDIVDAMAVNHDIYDTILGNLTSSEPKRIYACGFGCCLIDRKVLDKIAFRDMGDTDAHSDSFFYADVAREGFSVYFDSHILCSHDNFDWKL